MQKVFNIQDKDDVDFIALALKLNLPIWSNDKDLKKQTLAKVYTTKEVISLLDQGYKLIT